MLIESLEKGLDFFPEIRIDLTPEAAVAARIGYGGTAPIRVTEQLARLRDTLETQHRWAAAYSGPRG